MAELTRYVLVNIDDQEEEWEYDRFDQAKAEAVRRGALAVVQRTYTYDDSELVWAPNGGDVWPPPKRCSPVRTSVRTPNPPRRTGTS